MKPKTKTGQEPEMESAVQDAVRDAVQDLGTQAVAASRVLARASTAQKNEALVLAAAHLKARAQEIITANKADLKAGEAKGLKASFMDRLMLDEARIGVMADGIAAVAKLDDPVGRILEEWERPSGLSLKKVSVPLGVIGVIYESRPNVTADAAALCLKAGNATILRGGSDSFQSSGLILQCMQAGLQDAGLPLTAVQRIGVTDRAAVGVLLTMSDTVDVIVPRGGKGLIERIRNESRIPVFSHLDGLCHTYVHASADLDRAHHVVLNAKMRRTGICGATETLLVDGEIHRTFLPPLIRELHSLGCGVRGDQATCDLGISGVTAATAQDWDTEYLDPILSVRVVSSLTQAVEHIAKHGSKHTEAILARDPGALDAFAAQVDAGIIMQNASTQFADGAEFGMGAEIGISTGKMHARGPVGAAQLTSYKYIVTGNNPAGGTVRA